MIDKVGNVTEQREGYDCEAYKWTLGSVPKERSLHVGSIQKRTLCLLRCMFVCMCQFWDVLEQAGQVLA